MKYLALRIITIHKIIFSFVLLYTLYLLLNTPITFAQESPRVMTVIPPASEHKLDPGATAEGTVKIINDGNEPLTFSVGVNDFIVQDTKGTPYLLPDNTLSKKYSAASWIGITPSTFTVQPRERKDLSFYIQVPPDASPGGHYAAIIYTPTDSVGVTGTGTAVQTQIGTLFYITVNGPINEQAEVSIFKTAGFQEYGPIRIETQIKNLGDLHIRPGALVTIKNIFGQTSYALPLPGQNIFPEAARDYEVSLGKKLMIGRYTAELSGTYGQKNDQPLKATITFWVFPWKITVVIILIIVAAVLGALYMRREDRKLIQKAEEEKSA